MTITFQTKSPAYPVLLCAFFALGVLLPFRSAMSQAPIKPPASTPDPVLQRHPVNIESSQPDPHEDYLIGGGDEIVVSVAGRPELSGTHTVGPDGRITIPIVGTVLVGDKSRDDAARAIDESLSKGYSGTMTSTVQVTKYGSNHILLLGAIERPGLINFDQPPSLLEAITRGGAVLTTAKGVQTVRKCIIYRGDDQVMNVNISDRFDGRRALNDIRLRRNDIIYVPENQESLVSVLGEVKSPGPIQLTSKTTLASLLANAGGITEKAGNPTIQIVEPSTGRVQTIKFKQLLDIHGGSDVTLHDGDIVYVPRSGLATVGYVMQQLGPITGLGSTFAIAH